MIETDTLVIPARDHQPDLLARVVTELQPAPGKPIPEQGLRVTLAAAPGTGKTWISREAARRLTPHRRTLVMVHTLDLLIQTAAWWRKAGHTEPAIAVCAVKGNEELEQLSVRCTTSAPRLALWGGNGPVTVFATYASLAHHLDEDGQPVPGPLEEAMAGTYGQILAPFDLAVIDEAHRTAGDLGKPWAAIHDNTRIPADRRLYMTATPRLFALAGTDGQEGGKAGAGRLIASMDDESIFGKHVVLGLLEAVERGVLARFEIDVLEVRDPADDDSLPEDVARERRLAALQAALLTQWKDSGIRSVLSFHNRTRDAMHFARGLPAVAADLHASDPGRFPDPDLTCAEWLSGEHDPAHRRRVVQQFANGLDDQGNDTAMGFLATCRVLGEGADITGRRGVDAVVFADTRGSVVDVVQNVGRALRQKPGQGKTARIIVPIFLTPDEDPQDMTTSPQYKPLVAILQALRAYEDKIIEKLVLRRDHTGRGQADEVLADDPQHLRDPGGEQQGQDADAGDRHAEEGSSGGKPGDRALLRFFTPRDAATVVRFLRTRVLQPESVGWLTGYQLLCRWTTEHGHARVPQKERVPLRADGESEELYPLGRWCTEQLRGHRDGTLKAWRFQLLDELGMEWDGSDARFRAKIAVYRRYYEQHHTLAAPLNTIFEDQPVGQDLANLRKPNGLGKKPERAAQRRAMLEAIDPDWKPAWALPWQRHYAKVRWCLTEGGAELPELLPGVRIDGDDLGTWITEQQHTWGALSPTQRDRLARLDIQAPAGTLNAPAARPGPEAVAETAGSAAAATAVAVVPHTANTWDKAMAALRQYRDREGHTRVPRGHREVIHIDHRGSEEDAGAGEVREEHIKLGVFRSNTRARRDRLTPSQRHEAENVGLL